MIENNKILERLTIDDLETLKVLSEPTRMEIMRITSTENKRGNYCTVKHLAKTMGVSATKLYYHIKLLEDNNLLVVGDTRIVSGIIEKHYHVIAWNITLSKDTLSLQDEFQDESLGKVLSSIEQIVGSGVNNVRTSLQTLNQENLLAKKEGRPLREQVAMQISQDHLLLSADQAISFEEQLVKMINDFEVLSDENLKSEKTDLTWYESTQMFVPQYQRKLKS